jgi:hypothetical protein
MKFGKKSYLNVACLGILFCAVGAFLLRAFSHPATTDSGAFSALALHMAQGKQLYVDVWDNKPPGVFLLYQLAIMGISKSWFAIHVLLAFLNGILFWLIFSALKKVLQSAVLALLLCLGFGMIYFDVSLYSTGGLTEEFGTMSLIMGSAIIILFVKRSWLPTLGIALISLAPWFKEPFAFISALVLLYLFFFNWEKLAKWKLVLAIFLPHILMGAWLFNAGILDFYIETIIRNIAYTKADGTILFSLQKNYALMLIYYWNTNYLFCLAIGVSFFLLMKEFILQLRCKNLIFYVLFGLASAYAVFMSAKGFGHYFQMGSFFLLSSATLVLWYCNQKSKIPIYAILRLVFTFYLTSLIYEYAITTPFSFTYENANKNHLTEYIQKHKNEGDELFVESQNLGAMYLETGCISSVQMPVAFGVHIETDWGVHIMRRQDSVLRAKPPKFVLQNRAWEPSTGLFNTREYFNKNYVIIDSMQSKDSPDLFYLLKRKELSF